jgi:hypothetical protein
MYVQPVDGARPCAPRIHLRLQRGTALGRERLVRPASLVRSSTPGSVPESFDVVLPVDLLQAGTNYGIRIESHDAHQRSDEELLRFAIAPPGGPTDKAHPVIEANVVHCPS